MEFLRGTLSSRSAGIVVVLALLFGSGASAFAMGPGSPSGDQRPAPTMARFFTINDVLAKVDTQKVDTAASNQSLETAAADRSVPTVVTPQQQANVSVQAGEPFGLATFRAPEGLLWVKWRGLEKDLQAEARLLAHCRAQPEHCVNPAAQKFIQLIEESRKLSARVKIDRINRTINAAVRYTTDLAQHGVPDQWTAPLATLTSGQGDCEDYAIAKYVALRQAGFSPADLKLLLVHDRVAHQDHAVVGVRHNGRWLMLDNRHEALIEQKDAWHFAPLFALDHEGVKLFAAPYAPSADAPAMVATGPANSSQQASSPDLDAVGVPPELRLDTFEPPALRGRL